MQSHRVFFFTNTKLTEQTIFFVSFVLSVFKTTFAPSRLRVPIIFNFQFSIRHMQLCTPRLVAIAVSIAASV